MRKPTEPLIKQGTPGSRLRMLRESIGGLTQQDIERIGGPSSLQVSRAERDQVQFRSAPLIEGLARAYGLSLEKMSGYIQGFVPLEEAISIARPHVEQAMRELRASHRGVRRVEDALRRASAQADIRPATRGAAVDAFADRDDLTMPEMVRHILDLNDEIRGLADRHRRAPRSGSDAPK